MSRTKTLNEVQIEQHDEQMACMGIGPRAKRQSPERRALIAAGDAAEFKFIRRRGCLRLVNRYARMLNAARRVLQQSKRGRAIIKEGNDHWIVATAWEQYHDSTGSADWHPFSVGGRELLDFAKIYAARP